MSLIRHNNRRQKLRNFLIVTLYSFFIPENVPCTSACHVLKVMTACCTSVDGKYTVATLIASGKIGGRKFINKVNCDFCLCVYKKFVFRGLRSVLV
jgi:hypothetical protein